jgi:hypothetical protein
MHHRIRDLTGDKHVFNLLRVSSLTVVFNRSRERSLASCPPAPGPGGVPFIGSAPLSLPARLRSHASMLGGGIGEYNSLRFIVLTMRIKKWRDYILYTVIVILISYCIPRCDSDNFCWQHCNKKTPTFIISTRGFIKNNH